MAKAKAPRWLTESFRDGVDQFATAEGHPPKPYPLANPWCWLARHDPARAGCDGALERFHYIGRQRVENALGALLPFAVDITFNDDGSINIGGPPPPVDAAGRISGPPPIAEEWRDEITLLAAWDPRNGGLGCEGHHRRFDGHQVSLPRHRIIVPRIALPGRVVDFAGDYGLESDLERKFR